MRAVVAASIQLCSTRSMSLNSSNVKHVNPMAEATSPYTGRFFRGRYATSRRGRSGVEWGRGPCGCPPCLTGGLLSWPLLPNGRPQGPLPHIHTAPAPTRFRFRSQKTYLCRVYVPDSQEFRYVSCSVVSVSIRTPMACNLRRAISLSSSAGSVYTRGCKLLA